MNRKYIGITLGPIQNTLELSNTPAGLWAASYLFSKMASDICQELIHSGILHTKFLTPYFELKQGSKEICLPINKDIDLTILRKKGVGFFHDRIIYEISGEEQQALLSAKDCIDKVESKVCNSILAQLGIEESLWVEEKQNLQNYFKIYTICMPVEENCSPIRVIASALDHLENEHYFWTCSERDYLWEILSDNENVKKSWMAEGLEDWQLIEDKQKNNIINIPEMARQFSAPSEENKKKRAYFALVQADGDRMGELLGELREIEEIRQFSRKCLMYTAKCVERILAYGGIVIYAGGDDLLFLAPVESYKIWDDERQPKKKNILELLVELKDIFAAERFGEGKKLHKKPTLSMGVTIQYHKHPLYEVLGQGSNLLFNVAKSEDKDTLAIQLKKHSGKSSAFSIPSFSLSDEIHPITALANGEKSAELLTSLLRHIAVYESVFHKAIIEQDRVVIKNVFVNLLLESSDEVMPDASELNSLVDILCSVASREKNPDNSKKIYVSILQYIKFFGEDREGGKANEDH